MVVMSAVVMQPNSLATRGPRATLVGGAVAVLSSFSLA
jgi:hypothetical protein